ncbi:hypothetical protein AB0G02_17050 [Actinosynnema sp. NPDC023658]|uniref:hypothetical protein n=1 Tax=Actinosynnema sp. NPDC023658 TaxID=3155465 RepID=UPI0033EF3C64
MSSMETARLVAAQLGVLAAVGALPCAGDGVPVGEPVPVWCDSGEVVLWRHPVGRGYVDVAARPCWGAPLVAFVPEGRAESTVLRRPWPVTDPREEAAERYRQRVQDLAHLARVVGLDEPVVRRFDRGMVEEVLRPRVDTRTLPPCARPPEQEADEWALAACVQGLLAFYRYPYDQERLATELGLGTGPDPVRGTWDDVALAVRELTGKALSVEVSTAPTFAEHLTEVREQRPSISFVPGRARVVTGYTRMSSLRLIGASFAGLLVQDPAEGAARWENYDAMACVGSCTARVTLVP